MMGNAALADLCVRCRSKTVMLSRLFSCQIVWSGLGKGQRWPGTRKECKVRLWIEAFTTRAGPRLARDLVRWLRFVYPRSIEAEIKSSVAPPRS